MTLVLLASLFGAGELLLAVLGGDELGLTLLDDVHLLALVLGQGDGDGLVGVTDGEDVVGAGGELVAALVLQAGNVEGAGMALDVDDLSDAATVSSSGDHHDLAGADLDDVGDLAVLGAEDDGVGAGDLGVGVADAATVVGGDHGDTAGGGEDVGDLAELDLGLGLADLDEGEASLDVVQETEAVTGLGELDDVLEASGVLDVGARAGVDEAEALTEDHVGLVGVEGVLQTVAEDDQEGKALTDLVGSGGRAGSEDSVELAQHPVLGGEQALKMLLGHDGQ
eukprot:425453_1